MLEYLKELLGENYSDELKDKLFSKIDENYVDKKVYGQQLKDNEKNHKEEIKQIRLQNAIDSALSICGAKNKRAVYALLDREQIEIDEQGDILGLENQISQLKKTDSFLFESKKITGINPAEKGDTSFKSPKQMNYNELCEYLSTQKNL